MSEAEAPSVIGQRVFNKFLFIEHVKADTQRKQHCTKTLSDLYKFVYKCLKYFDPNLLVINYKNQITVKSRIPRSK